MFTAACVVIFFTSTAVLSRYTAGDQVHYRSFYAELYGVAINDISELQMQITGSSEPAFGILMWFGASLKIEKLYYISAFNVLLAVLVAKRIMAGRSGISPLIFTVLTIGNFYFVVLMTSAERLKFAYIAALFAALSASRIKSVSWLLISVTFHFQFLIVILALAFGKLATITPSRFVPRSHFFCVALGVVISLGVLIIVTTHCEAIVHKMNSYSAREGLTGLAQILTLIVATCISLPYKREPLGALLFLVAVSAEIGGERTNMIAATMYFWHVIRSEQLLNYVSISLLLYLNFKSVNYIVTILETGQGF